MKVKRSDFKKVVPLSKLKPGQIGIILKTANIARDHLGSMVVCIGRGTNEEMKQAVVSLRNDTSYWDMHSKGNKERWGEMYPEVGILDFFDPLEIEDA